MNETADKIASDKSILTEADFQPLKTWIEYVNRLVGVAIGLFIIALFYKSIPFRKDKPVLFWLSMATLVGVIIQGWFGSIVVSTNLTTWTITIHLFLALLIVAILVYLLHVSNDQVSFDSPPSARLLLIACMVALLTQVFFGTEVRGAIDVLASNFPRESWINQLGTDFIVHRSFSWVVLILNTLFFLQIRKTIVLKTLALTLFLLILCSLATGVGMAYFNVLPVLQPLHLVIATIAFGVQLSLFFKLNYRPLLNN